MSTALTPIVFSHPVFGDIRTVHSDNQVWFVATDIARALEHASANHLVRNVSPFFRDKVLVDTSGGPQEVSVLSQAGLVEALVSSRRLQSRSAREWLLGLLNEQAQKKELAADTETESADPRVRIGDLIRMGTTLWEVDDIRFDALDNMAVLERITGFSEVNDGAVVPMAMLDALLASEMATKYQPVD